jgi:gliding motility-associated-like protein
MKNLAIVVFLSLYFLHPVAAQTLLSRWQYNWGGASRDYLANIIPLPGNKYLIGGTSQSTAACTKSSVNYGALDMALFVLDDNGNKLWEKSYGGISFDKLWDVKKVPAGGFILVGETESGPSGIKTSPKYGAEDIWVVRVDDNGNMLWEKTYGTLNGERALKVIPTTDGGFLLAGNSGSGSSGFNDYLAMKIDAAGNILWTKFYGGIKDDVLFDMVQMPDGNFLLSGSSNSATGGIKTAPQYGSYDHWVICIQPNGIKLWDQSYGSLDIENGGTLLALKDGNYLLTGDLNYGGTGLLRKIDPRGNLLWAQSCNQGLYRMAAEDDNGDIYVAGESYKGAGGCKTSPLAGGNPDFWILAFTAAGVKIGDLDYGGNGDDYLISDIRVINGDVWVLGQTNSPRSGNKTVDFCAGSDGWIIRLSRKLFVQLPTPDDICSNTNNFDVHFTALNLYQPGNVFTAQLSDINGNFGTYTNIGSVNSNTSGSMPVTLPPGLPESDNYKIRVVATIPADTSAGYSIVYHHAPQVFLGNDTAICSNIPITLNPGAQSAGTQYLWSDGSTGNAITVSTAGTYSCNVQNRCGAASGTIRITTKTTPVADIGNDRNFCEGVSIPLQSSSQAADVTYLWNNGAVTPSITINTGGPYWLQTTNACGATRDAIVVTMDPKPVSQFNKDSVLCYGTTRTLDAGSGYATYLWYDGQGGATRTVHSPGEYWVLITGNNGCTTRDTATIKRIAPLPAGFLPADTTLCSYEDLTLRSTIPFQQHTWSTGDHQATILVNQPGIYWLQGTDRYGCTGRDSLQIGSKQCPYGFFMPTAFSPNNDGRNELCRPRLFGRIVKYHFILYNRWGQKVFDSTDPTRAWDGRINGRPAETGTYVWSCLYQLENRGGELKKGTVLLVR